MQMENDLITHEQVNEYQKLKKSLDDLFELLKVRVEIVLNKKYSILEKRRVDIGLVEGVEIVGDTIEATVSQYLGGGEYEESVHKIPSNYLYNDNWLQELEKEIEEKTKAEKFLKDIQVEAAKKRSEEQQRKLFENLKKKFEPHEN